MNEKPHARTFFFYLSVGDFLTPCISKTTWQKLKKICKVVGNGTSMYSKFRHSPRLQGSMSMLVFHRMTGQHIGINSLCSLHWYCALFSQVHEVNAHRGNCVSPSASYLKLLEVSRLNFVFEVWHHFCSYWSNIHLHEGQIRFYRLFKKKSYCTKNWYITKYRSH
jgi:hypothetical protein